MTSVVALAAVGALTGLALPHPLIAPRTSRAVEAAGCAVVFGLAFIVGAGGVGTTPGAVLVLSGVLGVALYLGLLALLVSRLSRRWIPDERRHPFLRS